MVAQRARQGRRPEWPRESLQPGCPQRDPDAPHDPRAEPWHARSGEGRRPQGRPRSHQEVARVSAHFPYGVGVEPCAPARAQRYPPRKRPLCAWSRLGRGTKGPRPWRGPQGAGPQVLSPPPSHGGGDDCRWRAPSGEGREPGRGWGSHWRPRRDGRRGRPEDSYTWQPSGLTDNCISGGAGGARFQESGKGVQSQELGGAKMSIFPPSPLRRRRPRPHKRPRP